MTYSGGSASDHLPPNDPYMERAMVGAMAHGTIHVNQVRNAGLGGAAVFYSDQNRVAAAAMYEMTDKGLDIDPLLLVDYLRQTGRLEAAGGAPSILSLPDDVPAVRNGLRYARAVHDLAYQRRVREAGVRLIASENGDAKPLLLEALELLETRPVDSDEGCLMDAAVEEIPPEPEWFCEALLAPGAITLLGGPPKAGKTTFVFALLRAMYYQELFLGLTTRRGEAYLLSEERGGTIKPKHERFLNGQGHHLLMHHQTLGQDWPSIVHHAVNYCERHDLEILIVDTLSRWTGLRGDDENSSGAILEAMEPLLNAAATGLAVIALHHHRKSGGEYGAGMRGSNQFAAVVDVIVDLERRGQTGTRKISITSRLDAPDEPLLASLGKHSYTLTGPESDAAAKVTDALTWSIGKTINELADETGLPRSTVERQLRTLESNGTAGHTGSGTKADPTLWTSQK